MAWTAPMTAVANAVFTAAQFNTHVRDNLLETAPAKATTEGSLFVATGANAIAERTPGFAQVATSETTTSTSYTDLATAGPALTADTGTKAIVFYGCAMENNTSGFFNSMSIEVSGETTIAASSTTELAFQQTSSTTGQDLVAGNFYLFDTLNAGTNTFTAKYRVTGGTGSFRTRNLAIIPL